MGVAEVIEYVDNRGRSPFAIWFNRLPPIVAAKVTSAVYQVAAGNRANLRGVGEGVLERKIDFGPGYRVYFGREGKSIVVLLGGGDKRRQQRDIEVARVRWLDFRLKRGV